MGLFSKKGEIDQGDSQGEKGSTAERNPLAPPSAQKGAKGLTRLPSAKPSGRPKASGSRGPQPPAGLQPSDLAKKNQEHSNDSTVEAPRLSSAPPPAKAGGDDPTTVRPSSQPMRNHERETDPPPVISKNSDTEKPGSSKKGDTAKPIAATPPGPQMPASSRANPVEPFSTEPAPQVTVPNSEAAKKLFSLLREAVDKGASDLHLTRGVPPMVRMDGYLTPLEDDDLTKATCEALVMSVLNPVQRQKFEQDWELDFSLDNPEAGRFRVNVHRQRGGIEAAFRVVNDVILPLRRLGLPGVVEEIARRHSGLVLVTGPTGSGKTTTLASIVDQINNERQSMVITIEDPIEYVHTNKRSIIKQREITSDTKSFVAALRHVLRQDPDVIVVGEMRDLETISTALTAAETGHLVFATLHTPDATQTVDRMIDVFPPHQQEQARIQVANTLEAIIAQQLIPVPGNRGRVVAVEILIATVAVKSIVRSGKNERLFTTMQTNWEQGMITMDKSLKTLYNQGLISFDDAIARCKFPLEFDNL